jgi:hypothetical protein
MLDEKTIFEIMLFILENFYIFSNCRSKSQSYEIIITQISENEFFIYSKVGKFMIKSSSLMINDQQVDKEIRMNNGNILYW